MKSFTTSAVATLALVVLVGALQLQQGSAEGALETGHGPEAEDALRPDDIPEGPFVEVRAGRHSRATCDLLSFQSKWVTPNHAACAAHCIAMLKGFKGGYCKNTVCHCRK